MISRSKKGSRSRRQRPRIPNARTVLFLLSSSSSVSVFVFGVVTAAILLVSPVVECWSPLRLFPGVPDRSPANHRLIQRAPTKNNLATPDPLAFQTRSERALDAASSGNNDNSNGFIDYQSDAPTYGRGEQHLSAVVCEGDTVVYRTGYWYVDGSLVGDDLAPVSYRLCRVGSIQLVWTHNCEHGVLRGLAVEVDRQNPGVVSLKEPLEDIEFGPEQLIARIRNIDWQPKDDDDEDGEGERGTCPLSLDDSLWEQHDGHREFDEWVSL